MRQWLNHVHELCLALDPEATPGRLLFESDIVDSRLWDVETTGTHRHHRRSHVLLMRERCFTCRNANFLITIIAIQAPSVQHQNSSKIVFSLIGNRPQKNQEKP